MRHLKQLIASLTLLLVASNASATVNASLDRQRGAVGSPLLLTLEVTQADSASPDLTVLEPDFAILGSRKSALSSFRGGQAVITQRWLITLSPRHPGLLAIPAIAVGTEQSQPLSFTAIAENSLTPPENISLETSLELPLIYNRSATTLNVRLFYRTPLQHAEITEPLINGVRVYPLGDQRYFKEQRQGQVFNVIEQRYALLPEQVGQFEVPALQFNGRDGASRELESHSRALGFESIAWPTSAEGAQLAASELRLDATWDQALDNLKAGDTRTLTLSLEGHNVPADWLPALEIPSLEGISSRPGAERREQQVTNGVLVSRLHRDFQLLFTRSGSVALPTIDIPWWDYVREQRDLARLPLPQLTVAPLIPAEQSEPALPPATGPAAADATTKSPHVNDSNPWTAWLWAVVALICAAGWSLARARIKRLESALAQSEQQLSQQRQEAAAVTQTHDQEQGAYDRLSHCCRYGSPEQVHASLIEWARSFWPDQRITDLGDIEASAAAPTLTYLLRNLEHRLQGYDENEPWPGQLALDQISRLRRRRADQSGPPLQPTRMTDHVEA